MVYLPTFGWFLGQMLVNIPYMEHLGILYYFDLNGSLNLSIFFYRIYCFWASADFATGLVFFRRWFHSSKPQDGDITSRSTGHTAYRWHMLENPWTFFCSVGIEKITVYCGMILYLKSRLDRIPHGQKAPDKDRMFDFRLMGVPPNIPNHPFW